MRLPGIVSKIFNSIVDTKKASVDEDSESFNITQKDHETLQTIQDAIKNNHKVDLIYQKNKDPRSGERRSISPSQIALIEGTNPANYYIRAFCHLRNDWRTFKIGSIAKVFATLPRLEPLSKDPEPFESSVVPQMAPPPPNFGESTIDSTAPSGLIRYKIEKPTKLYKVKQKVGDIEPTNDEYSEIKSMDIDPDTHDRALVRHIRNRGISHQQIKEICSRGIPLEYYDQALDSTNGDHVRSMDEAMKYRQYDEEIMAKNKDYLRVNPQAAVSTLDKQRHDEMISGLFVHHSTLSNMEEELGIPTDDQPDNDEYLASAGEPYLAIPGRRRANEWIQSELAKIVPQLRTSVGKNLGFNNLIPTTNKYYDAVDSLTRHYEKQLISAATHKEHVAAKRKIKALINIGDSMFYPKSYEPNIYEEE